MTQQQNGGDTTEWGLWEVFLQTKKNGNHEHAGNVHAPDAEMALQNGRDLYTRRGSVFSIWVVPSTAVTASAPSDAGPFFDAHDARPYVHPQFFKTPHGVKNL